MNPYTFKTPPYSHQRKALKRLLKQGYGGALLCEPRTGKTKITIDWLCALNQMGRVKAAIVVCPNRVLGTWVREVINHAPRSVHVTVWDAVARKNGPPPIVPGYQLHLVVVNYEAFATPGRRTESGRRSKTTGRFATRATLLRWVKNVGGEVAMILDESHKVKSPSGKAANMIVRMGDQFKYRLILTGTPLTKAKRPHDIYMQWKFLNPDRFADLPTANDFKHYYGQWTNANGFPQFLRPRNMKDLQQRIRMDAVVVRRADCFDLPPREDIVVPVPLTTSRDAYNQMAEEMIIKLAEDRTAEASLKIVQTLRLGQITSGFVTDDQGETVRLGFEKADVLQGIMDEELDKEQKLVVVARWKADLDLIEDMARELKVPVWSIRGKVKRRDSDRAIVEFRDHDGPGVIVLQPAASSLGIDLSTASHMIWYSHTPSWVDFTQCCDRIALSRTSTTFTHLVATQSVDEVLMNTLATDGDVGRAILSHPEELIKGHHLDLDDSSRLRRMASPMKGSVVL